MEEHEHHFTAEEEDEEMNPDEMADHANDKIDALVSLLIKKGVISGDEFDHEYEELFED